MKLYNVAHQDQDNIVVEGVFEKYTDAVIFLADSIYIEPFIIVDDGTLNLDNLSPEDAKKFVLKHIEFQPSEHK